MSKILIKNGRIFEGDELVKKDILIENEFIKKIEENVDENVDRIVDINKKIVLPGIIDPHVHFREPGMEYKEDFFSGSKAAAKGGITTILDMPNNDPLIVTIKNLEIKRELAKKSVVNYGLHFGASVDDNIEEIKNAKNIASVKVFMNVSTGKMLIEDDNLLKKVFINSKLVTVHAEDGMVNKAVELTKECGNKLYLCHISQKSEIDYIRKNKTDKIFVEVTPHHLFLTKDDDKDNFTKMKPNLRNKEDQEALWQAINEGLVNTIGTDHAPHTKEDKIEEVYGVPGNETVLPLLLNAVNDNKLSLKKLVELTSLNPAKIFGIKNRGKVKEGYYADLTIIDLNLEKEVKNEELLTKCGWSPFNGWNLKGWPVMTIINGNVVFDNGKINNIKGKEVEYI